MVQVEQNSPSPYQTSWEHLCDELLRVEVLVKLQLLTQPTRRTPDPLAQFRGLVLTEAEVADLLANGDDEFVARSDDERTSAREYQSLLETRTRLETNIQQRKAASRDAGVYLALPHLAELFALNDFEQQCLVICLAPELDHKYEKLYAYLQDDVTRKKPSVNLVLDLLLASATERLAARAAFDPNAPLIKFKLLHLAAENVTERVPLLSRSLSFDDRMVGFLCERSGIDGELEQVARIVTPTINRARMDSTEQKRVRGFLESHYNDPVAFQQPVTIYCRGSYGSGRKAFAASIAAQFGLNLIVADATGMLASATPFEHGISLLGREAVLQLALLYVENFDCLDADDVANKTRVKALMEVARSCCRWIFLEGSYQHSGRAEDSIAIELNFPTPEDGLRKDLWQQVCGDDYKMAADVDLAVVASKFRFTPGQMRDALLAARTAAELRSPGNHTITLADLHEGCRAQSSHKLGTLARKIQPVYHWDDIVLPADVFEQLREICQRVVHRYRVLGDWGFGRKLSLGKGVNALFAGSSGTGKTMAAEIIANELALELYKIDLSGIVSKYIGETEKNLERVFEAAEDSNALLFFDEADALFGKRSEVRDSHDRYANIEISYLLQRMEQYEGVTILATNRRGNLDEAFTRRLAFTVHFPFPDEAHRQRIWNGIWPTEAMRDESVDLKFLAERFKLSGGNIKNVALAAAFLAVEDKSAITMAHVMHAVRREYQKMGKPLGPDELSIPVLEEVVA